MGSTSKFEGWNYLEKTPPNDPDFSKSYAVVVSGDGVNFCGHMLLNVGGTSGWYFHVAGLYAFPRFMYSKEFSRYLTENSKKELRRTSLSIPEHRLANQTLQQLLREKWLWGVLPNNCANFVEEVVHAGGGEGGLILNCPTLETF